MGPVRRYLRITKYSVVEVRIYLDDPALEQSWLLNPRNAALPRIMETVRPLVLPKLREENMRAQGKSKKKKGVKDVITGDDFEVSIFLTDLSTRHALLTKTKTFREEDARMKSNSSKLTGWLEKDKSNQDSEVIAIREESDEEEEQQPLGGFAEAVSEDEGFQEDSEVAAQEIGVDDKKKLGMKTSYEGFTIYGRILCLVVKRRGRRAADSGGGKQMLESWVSTQAAAEQRLHSDDEQ